VIGVPDEKLGQAVFAYVVPTEPGAVTDEQLRELVKAELIPQAGPHHVEFVERLPLTRSGKVDKKALRAQYAAR
jgi:acyl-coenzyme A synthetase/AMP-(fatty) acid ligase